MIGDRGQRKYVVKNHGKKVIVLVLCDFKFSSFIYILHNTLHFAMHFISHSICILARSHFSSFLAIQYSGKRVPLATFLLRKKNGEPNTIQRFEIWKLCKCKKMQWVWAKVNAIAKIDTFYHPWLQQFILAVSNLAHTSNHRWLLPSV